MAPNTDIATRALVVALKSPIGGKTTAEIAEKTGFNIRTINDIYARAIQRRFDPNHLPLVIRDKWLEDALCSGHPSKQTEETTTAIVNKVHLDQYRQEKSCADLAGKLSQDRISISAITVWRILKKIGFRKTKLTRKPGLTKQIKEEQLK
jgi:hypothetical protein